MGKFFKTAGGVRDLKKGMKALVQMEKLKVKGKRPVAVKKLKARSDYYFDTAMGKAKKGVDKLHGQMEEAGKYFNAGNIGKT